MKVNEIPAGLKQSATSLEYMLCTDMLFCPDLRLNFENSLIQIGKFLI